MQLGPMILLHFRRSPNHVRQIVDCTINCVYDHNQGLLVVITHTNRSRCGRAADSLRRPRRAPFQLAQQLRRGGIMPSTESAALKAHYRSITDRLAANPEMGLAAMRSIFEELAVQAAEPEDVT